MITHDLRTLADAIQDKKGKGVISLDLRAIPGTITDYFVICNADSTTNVAAIADNVIFEMKEKLSLKPLRMQGTENNFWVILDYGNIVVHIFQTPYRDFYRLEELWADAPRKEYAERTPSQKKRSNAKKEQQ